MSTRSLLTSESFRALSVTSAGATQRQEAGRRPAQTRDRPAPQLPAVFCFLMGGARGGLFCIPVATTTCELGTVIMAGVAGAMETAAFLTVFLGDSEEMGTLLSSYSFLFTVLLI